jgi:hypothetical protein
LQFEGAVGIVGELTQGTWIEHNEVTHTPYTGISVGWSWNQNPTTAGNNLIRNNNIHDTLQLMEDGGGIYTLGNQPGTVVSENYVHDEFRSTFTVYNSPIAGIYLDEGSTNITVSNNVVSHVPMSLYLQNCCGDESGNTIVNWTTDANGNLTGNTFITDGTFNPTNVVANAGLEPAYQDLLSAGVVGKSCQITEDLCPLYPNLAGPPFEDVWGDQNQGALTSPAACMQRASDYYNYCGGPTQMIGHTTTATYLSGGAIVQTLVVGNSCQISEDICPLYPNLSGPPFEDVWGDQNQGALTSPDACMQRASDYYNYCGGSALMSGHTTKATFYSGGNPVQSVVVGN